MKKQNNKSDSIFQAVIEANDERERKILHEKNATFSKDAVREKEEEVVNFSNLRNPFAHDIDRIIHCHAFARYMDKTQVFFQIKHDHISRRSLHVQMVTRIAKTIGRFLNLNEDLIEAIAYGHDIGHTPFGHAGENELAKLLEREKCGSFIHNAQSVRILQHLEHHGKGLNLTLPVLDGILGHNGEIESPRYDFNRENLSWRVLRDNLEKCLEEPRENKPEKDVNPSTMEGCVVRVSDIISYLGKDFEDAIILGIITREQLPLKITRVLGCTNASIVDVLCKDILLNSYGKKYIAFSKKVFEAYQSMKKFNYDNIYGCPLIKGQIDKFSKMVQTLFECYVNDITENNIESDIFKHFISRFETDYWKTEKTERMVADYIATMTDQYFMNQYSLRFIPQKIDYNEIANIGKFKAQY